jgi:hypothetical protein
MIKITHIEISGQKPVCSPVSKNEAKYLQGSEGLMMKIDSIFYNFVTTLFKRNTTC